MAENDPERLAEDLEREADELERRSDELKERTDKASQEWQDKRSDPSVPGAQPPAEGEESQPGSDGES
ncbi:MAG TPA: hypothetical protein VMA77_24275 [Solirubrobacteraceae bacterium]|nr:hypothetical protein [Solirubrobacteraceae bacterium]